MMVCHLFGAHPWLELMLIYCQLDPQKYISKITIKNQKVSFNKINLKMSNSLPHKLITTIKSDWHHTLQISISSATLHAFLQDLAPGVEFYRAVDLSFQLYFPMTEMHRSALRDKNHLQSAEICDILSTFYEIWACVVFLFCVTKLDISRR